MTFADGQFKFSALAVTPDTPWLVPEHPAHVWRDPMENEAAQPVQKTEKVLCKFIGEFLVGDNILRNAEALCRMHANNNGALFNKLMLVQMGSIIEASLDQIFYRARNHTIEGVPNIPEDERKEIAEKDVGRFAAIIAVMKKHKLLDDLGADIYTELDKLREYRNRVHIQVDKKPDNTSRREHEAFTNDIVNWSFKLGIKVLNFLTKQYPRPEHLEQYAHELTLPNAV
jgi:hypothetical protein